MCGVRLGVSLGLPRRCHRVRRLLNAFCFDTVSKMSMFRFSDFRIFDTAVYNKSDSVFLKRKSETRLNTSVRNTTCMPAKYVIFSDFFLVVICCFFFVFFLILLLFFDLFFFVAFFATVSGTYDQRDWSD